MEKYNYQNAVREDIENYIIKNELLTAYSIKDDIYNEIYDELFVSDNVTGNASGSYFCNAWSAEECLVHNWDLLCDAVSEFGYNNINVLDKGPEFCDVMIRCYLLGTILSEVIDEMWNE